MRNQRLLSVALLVVSVSVLYTGVTATSREVRLLLAALLFVIFILLWLNGRARRRRSE